jgi:hypothetical protein
MDFYGLSLPEASYLYMGLAIQAVLRGSSLRHLPGMLVLLWCLVLCWRASSHPGGYKAVLGYVGTSLILCVVFWPESVPFGRAVTGTVDPANVASYAASQDAEAALVTAADTGLVPGTLQSPALIAPGFRLLLRAITETPLALAKAINDKTHRTFSSVMPMSWLLGVELTTEVTGAIADWTHNCFLPAYTTLMQKGQGRTQEELLPWDGSPLRQELAGRQVVPGSQTGIVWLRGNSGTQTVPCDVYLDAVEFRTHAWLFELRSPKGTPLNEVFQAELGIDGQQQARFLVYREMLKAAGPAVPAPSLTAQYAALRGAGVAGGTVGGAAMGVKKFGGIGAALSAAQTALQGATSEFQRAVDGLSWLVGLAVFLAWWGPYMMGLMHLVLVGLFPFVMLWALIPGNQFQPLAHYFVALLFAASMPLWWALVDVAQRLAVSQAPAQNLPGFAGWVAAWTASQAWSMMITALGILLIPIMTGIVLFSVFRAVGALWRGTV